MDRIATKLGGGDAVGHVTLNRSFSRAASATTEGYVKSDW